MVAVAYPVVLLLLGLALLLLVATQKSYQYTFGVMLAWLAEQFRKVSIPLLVRTVHPFGFLADALDDANGYIQRKIGEGIIELEKGALGVWSNMIATIQWLGRVLAEIPHETGRALHLLRKATVPLLINAAVGPVAALVHSLLKPIEHLLHRHIPTLTVHDVTKLARQAVTVVNPFPRIRQLDREIKADRKRLTKLEKGAIVGTTAGIVAYALSKLGLSHLTRSQCKTNTKTLCGINPSALEALAADALLIVGTVSLVEFAKGMQGIIEEIEKPIRTFWRAA